MGDNKLNIIKPVGSLQNISGLKVTKRREERRKKQNHEEEQNGQPKEPEKGLINASELDAESAGPEKPKDYDNIGIDYRA